MPPVIVVLGATVYVAVIGLLLFAFFCADIDSPLGPVRWLSRLLLHRIPTVGLAVVQSTLGEAAAHRILVTAKYVLYERNPILQVINCVPYFTKFF